MGAKGPLPRIVSLSPVGTEILFALGVGEQVVGVTRYCDRPKEAQKLPKVGGFIDPQLEAIWALRPDLVVATPVLQANLVVEQLEKRQVRVIRGPASTLKDFRQLIRVLGERLGKSRIAGELVAKFDGDLGNPPAPFAKGGKRALLVVGTKPLVVAGVGTFPVEVIEKMGLRSVVLKEGPDWPVWSVEAILRAKPDLIVLLEGQSARKALEAELKPIWPHLKEHCKIIALNKAIFQRPSFDLPNEAKTLAAALPQ